MLIRRGSTRPGAHVGVHACSSPGALGAGHGLELGGTGLSPRGSRTAAVSFRLNLLTCKRGQMVHTLKDPICRFNQSFL